MDAHPSRVATLMVVYNHLPDFTALEAALRHSDSLVLIDNASASEVREELERFRSRFPEKCALILNDTNLGLSKAYNSAVERLTRDGFHWLYLLDHDACFADDFFTATRDAWTRLESQGENVGVVVPIVTDDPRYLGSSAGFRRQFSFLQTTMTSGILTNVDVFAKLGGFDERLFVEAADLDFTSRANRAGYRVCLLNRVLIVQQFGETPHGSRDAIRLAESLLRIRSFVRVGIGNSNMLRTHLSSFPPTRLARLYAALRWIVDQGYPWRHQARVTYVLDRVEELYIRWFATPWPGRSPPLERSVEAEPK